MEHRCSLTRLQVLATLTYPEPYQSSPSHQSTFWRYILFLSPIYSGSPKWTLSFVFPNQDPVYASSLTYTRYMPRLSHSLDFITRSISLEQYRSLSSSLCSFLHSSVTSSLLRKNIPLNTLFSNTFSLSSSLNVSDQVSHPYKTTGNYSSVYLDLFILE